MTGQNREKGKGIGTIGEDGIVLDAKGRMTKWWEREFERREGIMKDIIFRLMNYWIY